jgi:hypothetical protein
LDFMFMGRVGANGGPGRGERNVIPSEAVIQSTATIEIAPCPAGTRPSAAATRSYLQYRQWARPFYLGMRALSG